MASITATIITLNEEENIAECIKSAQTICNEIIVIDSHSTDKTVEIAESLGAKVIIQDYLGDGLQKDFGVQFAKNDWILSLDADERVDIDMQKEIKKLDLEKTFYDAFAFKRENYIGNRLQKIWSPDYVVRLYNKNRCRYLAVRGHSKVDTKNFKKLNSHIIHYSYKDLSDMAKKINKFSYRGAWMLYEKNTKVNSFSPILHGTIAFIRKYIFKKGFLYGLDGLTISIFTAFNTYLKYAMLIEIINNKKKK